jgi:hypothetical protein
MIDKSIRNERSSFWRFLKGISNTHEMLVILKDLLDMKRRQAEYQHWCKIHADFKKKREAACQFRRKHQADLERLKEGPDNQGLERWLLGWRILHLDYQRGLSRGQAFQYLTEPAMVEGFIDTMRKVDPIIYRVLLLAVEKEIEFKVFFTLVVDNDGPVVEHGCYRVHLESVLG